MLDLSSLPYLLAISGFVIGLLLGSVIVYSQFCTMGAVADIALSNNYGLMRSWLLAIVVALIGTQLAIIFGLLDIEQTLYLKPQLFWFTAIIGGLFFGFGMVISCGCGTRNLVMMASGDLRALITVIVLGLVGYMTIRGIFSIPRSWLYSATALDSSGWINAPSLNALFAYVFNLSDTLSRILATLFMISPLTWFIFKDRDFLHSPKRIFGGISVGSLVVAGWLMTGWIFNDEFEEAPPESLTFVEPIGDTIQYLMAWTGASINFGIAVVGGVIFGAFFTSLFRKEFTLRSFEDATEMGRYLSGGALMGMGGALAGGCTFGQGISGISTLSFISFLTLASILLGAFVGIRYLEHGSITAALSNLKP